MMPRPVTVILLSCVCAIASTSSAATPEQTPLLVVDWEGLANSKQLTGGEWHAATDQDPGRLVCQHAGAEPRQFLLVELVPPAIPEATYALRGRIRYREVTGTAYLEMWNHFPAGAFFTRTLANSGPLGQISGTSDWREFALPFIKNDEPSPEKLVVNLYLPGSGTVELSNLELIAPADQYTGGALPGAWWSDRTGGWIGGLVGAFLGVFVGCILAPLTATGRAKAFTLTGYTLLGVGSALCFLLGLVALISAQPYGVYYTLLLIGVLGTGFGFGGLVMARRTYQQQELRRMSALDIS